MRKKKINRAGNNHPGIAGSGSPKTTSYRTDILCSNEGFWINLIDHTSHKINIPSANTAVKHGYHAILVTRRNFGDSISRRSKLFSDCST